MSAVAQSSGHQPGNREVPGLMPWFNSWQGPLYCCCFLGQETLPPLLQPYPAVKLGLTALCRSRHSWKAASGWCCHPCINIKMSRAIALRNCFAQLLCAIALRTCLHMTKYIIHPYFICMVYTLFSKAVYRAPSSITLCTVSFILIHLHT